MALIVAGTRGVAGNWASLRAARIAAAISRTRLRHFIHGTRFYAFAFSSSMLFSSQDSTEPEPPSGALSLRCSGLEVILHISNAETIMAQTGTEERLALNDSLNCWEQLASGGGLENVTAYT
jgi:hypothetical protein